MSSLSLPLNFHPMVMLPVSILIFAAEIIYEEWYKLEQFIKSEGLEEEIGNVLRSKSEWGQPAYGTDNYNFKALPTGYINSNDGNLKFPDTYTSWWSSTGDNDLRRTIRGIQDDSKGFYKANVNKSSGISVRCLKD